MEDRKFDGLLFDKDGTLFSFQNTWANWMFRVLQRFAGHDNHLCCQLAQELGFDLDTERFIEGSPFVTGTPNFTIDLLCRYFPELTRSDIIGKLVTISAAAQQCQATPLKPLLAELRMHVPRIGVATNDHRESAIAHLRSADCDDQFDFIAGSDSGYGEKPDPAMLLAFCARFGIAPERCIMVGDSLVDMESGRRAGMTVIAVLTGVETIEKLSPHADVVLDDIGHLPKWLG